MSYILDAIRKSDQLRRRGEVPSLPTAATVASKPQAFMPYGLLGLMLVLVGIAIGWLGPWRTAQDPVAAIPDKAPVSVPPRPDSVQAPQMSVPVPAQLVRQREPRTEAPALAAPLPGPGETALARTEISDASSAASSAKRGTAAAGAPERKPGNELPNGAPEPKVGTRSELPLSIQQELPPMAVAMHAYAVQARDRLVSVDNRLLREGDTLAADLKLEQIIPDGMIFSYRGYRFRQGIK